MKQIVTMRTSKQIQIGDKRVSPVKSLYQYLIQIGSDYRWVNGLYEHLMKYLSAGALGISKQTLKDSLEAQIQFYHLRYKPKTTVFKEFHASLNNN